MISRSVFKITCAVIVFLGLLVVVMVFRMAASYRIAMNAVMEVDGHWSVAPGWPLGAETVALHSKLNERALVSTISAQRHNRSLIYLSLQDQDITPDVADAIASLDSVSSLNIIGCYILQAEAEKLLGMKSLEIIFVDYTGGQVVMDVKSRMRSNVKIDVRPNFP